MGLRRGEIGDERVIALVHDDPRTGELGGYLVHLTPTPVGFGGQRWWFACPGLGPDAEPCERRCRILYRPRGAARFACRECHRLTYECRQRHRDKWFHFWQSFDALDTALQAPWRLAYDPRLRARVDRAEQAFKAVSPDRDRPPKESEE